MENVNLVILRQIIGHKFNKSELRDLCFELQINYESLPGDTIDDMVRELVTYIDRRDRIRELVDLCQQKRPQIIWEDEVTSRITNLPKDLQLAVESRYVGVRMGSVSELEHFLGNSDKSLANAARLALEQLLDDDSRQVSSAAAKLLEKFNVASRTETSIRVEPKQTEFDWQEWVRSASTKAPREESRIEEPGAPPEARLKETIAIETVGGISTPLLQKDTLLPAEVTQTFSTAADGQTQVEIHLLFGGSESAADNVSLGKFLLDGIPPAPRGIPQILVRIAVGADLQLSVTATDQATLRTQSIGRFDLSSITPSSSTRLGGFGDFSDIFESIFGDRFGGQPRKLKTSRGSDLQSDLTISFTDAVLGLEKEVIYTRPEICNACHGSGAKPGSKLLDCETCKGSGEVRTSRQAELGSFVEVLTCQTCEGSGKKIANRCTVCGGSKLVQKRRSVIAKIPAGVTDGVKIRLRGQGAQGVDNDSDGDLYIVVHVTSHQYFTRENQDVILELPIMPSQAKSGGFISVPTVNGNVKLTIPSDIQHGQTILLRGEGIPNLREPSMKGNQLVRVIVTEPSQLEGRVKLVFEKTNRTFKRKRWFS